MIEQFHSELSTPNLCPYKDLSTNIYSSIMHNSPKVETIQTSNW